MAFVDGTLTFGIEVETGDGYRKIGYKFEPVGQIKFNEMYIKEEDNMLFRQQNRKLDFKIKTPRTKLIDSHSLVKIGAEIFDVIKIDNTGNTMTVYLGRRDNIE